MKSLKALGTLLFSLQSILLGAQSIPDGLYAMVFAEDYQLFIELHYDKAPMTVANFVGLAEGTVTNSAFEKGRPFFDGSSFDRVVPGHVVQGGVPDSDKSGNAGYTIPNEIHPQLNHKKAGAVGMANAGPDTGNNIFYITLGDRSYLDGDYTVFGTLLCPAPHDLELNTRIDSIRIIRVGKTAEEYVVDDQILQDLIEQVRQNNAEQRKAKEQFEEEYILTNYPDREISEFGWEYIIQEKGKGKKVKKRDHVMIRFKAHTPQGVEFGSTDECSSYWIPSVSEPGICQYIPGETSIVSGLDEAILEMKPGAKWTVILKPDQAYGIQGFYPPLTWGNKRFHISPQTTIIYEIEVLE